MLAKRARAQPECGVRPISLDRDDAGRTVALACHAEYREGKAAGRGALFDAHVDAKGREDIDGEVDVGTALERTGYGDLGVTVKKGCGEQQTRDVLGAHVAG